MSEIDSETRLDGSNDDGTDLLSSHTGDEVFSIISEKKEPVGKGIAGLVPQIMSLNLDGDIVSRESPIFKDLEKFFRTLFTKGIQNIYDGLSEEKLQGRFVSRNAVTPHPEIVEDLLEYDAHENTVLNRGKHTASVGTRGKKKFDRYYPMYEIAILKRLQQDIRRLGKNKVSQSHFNNLVSNIITEVLHLWYAFGNTLNPDTFEEILIGDKKKGVVTESTIGTCNSVINRYHQLRKGGGINPKDREDNTLLQMYKHFVPDGLQLLEAGRTNFSNSKIKDAIQSHFGESLVSFANIFQHWFYSSDLKLEKLNKLPPLLEDIIENVGVLRDQDIAFSEIVGGKKRIAKWILQESEYAKKMRKVFHKDIEWDKFEDFWRIITQGQEKDREEELSQLKYSVKEKRSEDLLRKKGKGSKEETEKVGGPFSRFSDLSPFQRKRFFVENVLGTESPDSIVKNKAIPSISGKNSRMFEAFIEFYASRHKELQNDKESIKELYRNALSLVLKETITLTILEEKHIEYEQILISWFRFSLLYRQILGQYNKKPGDDISEIRRKIHTAVGKEIDTMYGTREMIANELVKKEDGGEDIVFSGSNVQILAGKDGVPNSSVWDIDKMIKIHNKRFSHRPINLEDIDKFGYTHKGKSVLFKDQRPLFLPPGDDPSSQEIFSYLGDLLDFVTHMLQKKEVPEELRRHFYTFKSIGIDCFDRKTLWRLRKFLKYVVHILPDVIKTHENAIEETNFLSQNNDKLGIGLKVGKPKKLFRVLEKVITSYSGDLRRLSDLARARNVNNEFIWSIDAIITFLSEIKKSQHLDEYITQVIIEDNTGHPSGRGNKTSGYRDINLVLKTKTGNMIEVQFLVKPIFEWKETGFPANEMVKKYMDAGIRIGKNEYQILKSVAQQRGIHLPTEFKQLQEKNDAFLRDDVEYKDGLNISSDYLYNLSRDIGDKGYKKILQEMERLPYLEAWGKVVSQMNLIVFHNVSSYPEDTLSILEEDTK